MCSTLLNLYHPVVERWIQHDASIRSDDRSRLEYVLQYDRLSNNTAIRESTPNRLFYFLLQYIAVEIYWGGSLVDSRLMFIDAQGHKRRMDKRKVLRGSGDAAGGNFVQRPNALRAPKVRGERQRFRSGDCRDRRAPGDDRPKYERLGWLNNATRLTETVQSMRNEQDNHFFFALQRCQQHVYHGLQYFPGPWLFSKAPKPYSRFIAYIIYASKSFL